MGNTDPRHKSRKTKYEVKPQYEELSKQLNMQHDINQCYECMRAIKESDSLTSPSTGKSNQASIPRTANQSVETIGTTQQSASHNVAPNQVTNSSVKAQYNSTLVLPSYAGFNYKNKLKTTKDAHPEVHASRRKTRHRFLPKTSNASNSTLLDSAPIQGLKWVAIERVNLEEFSATKIFKNKGWKRRESAPGSDQIHREAGTSRLAAVDLLIRSTTGNRTPSSVCTRRADEFDTNGISSTRDTASRGPTTIMTPKSQFRTDPSNHGNPGFTAGRGFNPAGGAPRGG
ncbi:hypothetical protein F511_17683 [Dorcoceras hygrometricum]|uniref:Uncharacterized protein n=1 Tax=Dorcoceras hygrometricum TaxID=472368 RepID=A0A2Z7C7J6_9LAMI|nr:hypothetical protein F511_17683 [Dorcoceras hygrometricum]